MRILFVTRKYPPSTGGMQNAAFELQRALAAHNQVTLIKWGGSNMLLPVAYIWLFMQALAAAFRAKPDVIYLQDGVMAPLGWLLRLLAHRPTLITIHGKEATYGNLLYRLIVPPLIQRQDQVVVVSNDTWQTVETVLPGLNARVIFNGVGDDFYVHASRTENLIGIAQLSNLSLERLQQSHLLYTNGRLVRRKGVLWFIDNVMPLLVAADPSILYVVSGEGKDREVIEAAIEDRGLENHVVLLGRVSDELRRFLYNTADIFVMPNIPILGDMEGFGLVALEAASCGTTVVAADLEGIRDAVHDGRNGFLVTPGDSMAYSQTIIRELQHRSLEPQAIRDYTLKHYAWTSRAREYEAAMQELLA